MATGLEKIEAAAQINQCLSTSHSEPIVDQNQKLELDRREIVDPTKWPTWYKWVLVLLVSTMGMIEYESLLLQIASTYSMFHFSLHGRGN